MGSRTKVQTFTQRALNASTTDDKLNASPAQSTNLPTLSMTSKTKLNHIDQKLR